MPEVLRRVLLLSLATMILATGAFVTPAIAAQETDVTPPEVKSTGSDDDLTHILWDVVDTESGLGSITVGMVQNLTVTVDRYTPGTTTPVRMSITAIDPSRPISIAAAFRDVAGNDIAVYIYVDPVAVRVVVDVFDVDTFISEVLPGEIQSMPINGSATTSANLRRTLLATTQLANWLHDIGQDQLACLQLSSLELQIRAQVSRRRIAASAAEEVYRSIGASQVGLGCRGTVTY